MSPSELLSLVRDLCESESINDAAPSNLSFSTALTDVAESELGDLLVTHNENSGYFGGFQIRTENGHLLFERTGETISVAESGFETLGERDLGIDLGHYRGGFDRYRDEEPHSAAEYICNLVDELSSESIDVQLSGILRKDVLAEELVNDRISDRISDRVNPILWWSPTTLTDWLDSEPLLDTLRHLYDYENLLLLLFINDAPGQNEVTSAWDATDLEHLEARRLDNAYEKYSDLMEHARTVTRWQENLSPIHPDHIRGLRDWIGGPPYDELMVHALLAAFSREIEPRDSQIRYTISYEPEFAPEITPEEVYLAWGIDGLETVNDLYSTFQPHEDKDAFRDIWQLSITEQCRENEAGITALPELVNAIQSINDDLQAAAIEENFDELSNVLEDTQTLMANLTSRLSDAAAESSRDIQRLTFTLLGAIVANVFLVLRWSDRTLVPPFSLFVIVIIVGFYLPLIQGRINDLDETIDQVEEDYEFYERRIRRFNKDLFHLTGLSDRKDGYVRMAKGRRNRAQDHLRIIFVAIMIVWAVLGLWSGIAFEFGGLHTSSLIVSTLVLSSITLTGKNRKISHRQHVYFDSRWAVFVIIILLIAIGLQWGIGEVDAVSGVFPRDLPRFNNT